MTTDRLQKGIQVGDIVLVPAVITSIGGTLAAPTVALTSKYAGFAGTVTALTTVDAIQVIKDE